MPKPKAGIEHVACIGGGFVGSSWAVVFARAGLAVTVHDVSERALQSSKAMIRKMLEGTNSPVELSHDIQFTTDLTEALDGAGYIQESVSENLELKCSLLEELDKTAPIDALVASSTSALLPDSFLNTKTNPSRCLVAHPVNPPHLVPLVELCASNLTSPETMKSARTFLESLGMSPVTLKKPVKGFLLNRLQSALLSEAINLVAQDYCSVADLDKVMTDGLARRWVFFGPLMTAHMNAEGGIAGYMKYIGAAMEGLARDTDLTQAWSSERKTQIIDALEKEYPISELESLKEVRDHKIEQLNGLINNQAQDSLIEP